MIARIQEGGAARDKFTFGVVTAGDRVIRAPRLAEGVAAPEIPSLGAVGSDDRNAPADSVIAERNHLRRICLRSDADQPVLGIPIVGAYAVVGQIAIGIVGE